MTDDHKRTINAEAAVKDIRSGMTDSDLRDKYRLSENGLGSLFAKLVGAGLLQKDELDRRRAMKERSVPAAWKCPACGSLQTRVFEECPACGVIVAKYAARHSPRGGSEAGLAGEAAEHGPFSDNGWRDQVESQELPATRMMRSTEQQAGVVGVAAVAASKATPELFDQYEDQDESASDDIEDMVPEPRTMTRTEWLLLLVCPAVALLCFLVFWFRWTLETFKTLVHEMGHAIFGWVFAYPSFPAFDMIFGGGMTLHTQRSTTLLILIYIGFAGLLWMYRKNTATLVFLIVAICIHALFSFTKIHSIIILFMGHGTELIIGGLFIYRALSGRAVIHAVERPMYGVIGFFFVFSDLGFAYRLLTSASYRAEYESAKGGVVDMDFIRIAAEYLHTSMNSVAFFFFVCCVLTLVLSFLAFRYMEYIHTAVVALWVREPRDRAQGKHA